MRELVFAALYHNSPLQVSALTCRTTDASTSAMIEWQRPWNCDSSWPMVYEVVVYSTLQTHTTTQGLFSFVLFLFRDSHHRSLVFAVLDMHALHGDVVLVRAAVSSELLSWGPFTTTRCSLDSPLTI
jgi:hypothetical protein